MKHRRVYHSRLRINQPPCYAAVTLPLRSDRPPVEQREVLERRRVHRHPLPLRHHRLVPPIHLQPSVFRLDF